MTNNCTIVIVKGPNKGKMCKDVNRWCKHKSIVCNECQHTFKYQHTFNAHVCTASKTKVKVKIKPKPVDNETKELKQLVNKLQDELAEIKKQPKVQINNLTVITDDIFGQIVGEMGKKEGVKYLLDSLDRDAECLDIVDKVYLNGKDKNQYPIACKNENHFRFLGPNYKVVDDIGGDLIVSKITNSVQNAFLKASADLIQDHIQGDQTESLYSMYDMRHVQDKIKQMPLLDQKERLRAELAHKVTNPTHPFFQLE